MSNSNRIDKLNTFLGEQNQYTADDFIKILTSLNHLILSGDYYFCDIDIDIQSINLSSSIVPTSITDDIISSNVSSSESESTLSESVITNKSSLVNVLEKVAGPECFITIRRKYLSSILKKEVNDDLDNGLFSFTLPEFIIKDLPVFIVDTNIVDQTKIILLNSLTKLLFFNMAIVEEDENLSCSANQIDKLNRISKYLSDIKTDGDPIDEKTLRDILSDKIQFLQKKIELRLRIGEEDDLSFKEVDSLKIISNKNNKKENSFDELYDNCRDFYVEKKRPYQKRPIERVDLYDENGKRVFFKSDKEYVITSCKDVWMWSRHLRKRLKDESLPHEEALIDVELVLDTIKNEILTNEGSNQVTTFQSFALRSSYNLLFNTYIKILLKKETVDKFNNCLSDTNKDNIDDIVFIRDVFSKIKDKQDDMKIYDYHPYQTLLNFFRDFTAKVREDIFCLGIDKNKLEEKNEVEIIKKVETKIILIGKLYEDSIKLFNKNLKWCKSKHWNPIYLERESCIAPYTINVDNSEIELFVDSSFALPDNFDKIQEKWYAENQYRMVTMRSTKNRAQFEIHRIITENSVDRKKDEFEKKVKENEFKSVQIIAMFITISTFVLTNVKAFENKSLSASLAVMFAFAACMLLFNAFFKWLIRDSILVNLDVLRAGRTRKEKRNLLEQLTSFFTDYKYSFSDIILISLILGCGILSGYYRSVADAEQAKIRIEDTKTIQAYKEKVIMVYTDTLDHIHSQYDRAYKRDSSRFSREDSIKKYIQKYVKPDAIQKQK